MSQSDLARAAVVPVSSIADFEAGILALRPPDLDAIQDALERAGVELAMGETRTDIALREGRCHQGGRRPSGYWRWLPTHSGSPFDVRLSGFGIPELAHF